MSKSAKTLKPCQCSTFTAYDTERDVEYTTSCNSQTARDFAPGHDARLKSHLIRWGVLGYEIRVGDVTKSAEGWAEGYGFGYMVRAGIRRTQERAAAKAEKTMKKINKRSAERGAVKDDAPRIATAKVGRWTYEGTVEGDTFGYTKANGEAASTTKFTLV